MKMNVSKKFYLMLVTLAISLVILAACSSPKGIQGIWKATSASGTKLEITFTKEKFISREEGKKEESFDFDYEIVETKVDDKGKKYYVVDMGGMTWLVSFPRKNDEKTAVISVPFTEKNPLEGQILFALNRSDYPDYEEYVDKYSDFDSDGVYQGTWKIQDVTGKNGTITFKKWEFTFNAEEETAERHKYTLIDEGLGVARKGQMEYYTINDKGMSGTHNRTTTIVFPDKSDKEIAYMLLPPSDLQQMDVPLLTGKLYLVMHRTKTPDYDEYFEKYLSSD